MAEPRGGGARGWGADCGAVALPTSCAELRGVACGYHVGSAFLRHRVSLSHPSS